LLAGIHVSPTSGLVTTESGGTAQFSVVLESAPTADVTIGFTSSNPQGGGTVSPASLTFTPQNWNVPQTVTVTGADDGDTSAGDVAYSIDASPAVSADPDYNGLQATSVLVTNLEDDAPDLQVVNLRVEPETGLTSGSALVVRWDDANTITDGDATAGPWSDYLQIVNTTTGETLATAVIPYDPTAAGNGPIGPSDSRARHYNFTLP